MELGTLVRLIRLQRGMTQAQLAENAGVSVNTVRLYEAGKVTPKTTTLDSISIALGFSGLGELIYYRYKADDPRIQKVFEKSVPMSKKIEISRNVRGFSQEEVDSRCGFPEGTVQKYENELMELSFHALWQLSITLQVPLFVLSNKHEKYLKRIAQSHFQKTINQKSNILTGENDNENTQDGTDLIARLVQAASKLNESGKVIAIQRVEELTEIPRYQAKPTAEATSPTPERKGTPEE